jgi:hypothetical protein
MGYSRRHAGCEQGVSDLLFVVVFIVLPIWAVVALIKWIFGGSTFSSRDMEAFERAERVKKDLAAVQKMVGPEKPATDFSLNVSGTVPKPPAPPSGGAPSP